MTHFLLALTAGVIGAGFLLHDLAKRRGWKLIEPLQPQVPDAVAVFHDGWDDVVEDDELVDAWITDEHCAELDAWYGLPVLPDTPHIAHALSRLTNPR